MSKEMFGLPMVISVAKDVEVDDALVAEARELAGYNNGMVNKGIFWYNES